MAGDDVAAALVDLARAENATQLVLGASRRTRWQRAHPGLGINRVSDCPGAIDVHVISAEPDDGRDAALPAVRRVASAQCRRRGSCSGGVLAVVGLPLLTLVLANLRDDVGLPTVLLLYLVLVVAIGAVGGLPRGRAAVAGFLLAN